MPGTDNNRVYALLGDTLQDLHAPETVKTSKIKAGMKKIFLSGGMLHSDPEVRDMARWVYELCNSRVAGRELNPRSDTPTTGRTFQSLGHRD